MKIDEFLHYLQFDIGKASIPNWEVDWEDGPLPYKLYRGLPEVPLSLEVPRIIEGQKQPVKPDLRNISHFLWYVYGLTQYSESILSANSTESTPELMQSYRRFAPSGGALYPNELYVYLKIEELPIGIYHYDVAHHRLVLLREGNFDSYISRALGNRCEVSSCFGTVFISTMFWKNFFKYNNFAYRLQGLDTGVVMGQLLEAAKWFGFQSGVYYQFLDRAVHHLLGLSEQEESVYAVIPLSVEPTIWSANGSEKHRMVSASELCREVAEIQPQHYIRSKLIKAYPMLTKANEASLLEHTQSFTLMEIKVAGNGVEGKVIPLQEGERLTYEFGTVCRNRFSPGLDFILGKVSKLELANLLYEAMNSFLYRNDLDAADGKHTPRISLYGCFYNVDGIPNGAYQYDHAAHVLREIQLGDHRLLLQSGLSMDNVNLLQVPLCLHVIGDVNYYKNTLGYRGYRIQQMEAGILVQRLLFAAGASGMGGHPLLGYDVNLCDEIYRNGSKGRTSLIQIPLAHYRPRPWLVGSLSS